MKFLELLQAGVEFDCDLIIGDCEMPASFVWDKGCKITDYGINKYKAIVDAEFKFLKNGNIEIFCDDADLGEEFTLAAAGYISNAEFKRIFGDD